MISTRLSNFMSVNFFWAYSDVFGIPDKVSVFSHAPFFIDLDEHGGDETQKRIDVRENPYFYRTAFDVLFQNPVQRCKIQFQ